MAAGMGDVPTRQAALAALPKVARIGTHLFTFLDAVQNFRGWGRSLRRAVGQWYNGKDPDALAYQLLKYRQRNGWSHRDALRLASPKPATPAHGALYRWVVANGDLTAREIARQERPDGPMVTKSYDAIDRAHLPALVHLLDEVHGRLLALQQAEAAYCQAQSNSALQLHLSDLLSFKQQQILGIKNAADRLQEAQQTIHAAKSLLLNSINQAEKVEVKTKRTANQAMPTLSWEMLPTEMLGDPRVWEALLPQLPMTALLRNLARMTANGVIAPASAAARLVTERLTDETRLRQARIHPIAILGALMTYRQGHGMRGSLTWNPVAEIIDALDAAFYLAFGNVPVTNQRWLLALDVSGSMDEPEIAGMPGLTPRIASAAMSLVTARVEPHHTITAFSHNMVPVTLSPRQRLDDVIAHLDKIPMGRTDCALPMRWALERKVSVDTFVVYTDSETRIGGIHPVQALADYRQKMGIPAKLVVVGMVANQFSIADPEDAGMLDVVGFDTATPCHLSPSL